MILPRISSLRRKVVADLKAAQVTAIIAFRRPRLSGCWMQTMTA